MTMMSHTGSELSMQKRHYGYRKLCCLCSRHGKLDRKFGLSISGSFRGRVCRLGCLGVGSSWVCKRDIYWETNSFGMETNKLYRHNYSNNIHFHSQYIQFYSYTQSKKSDNSSKLPNYLQSTNSNKLYNSLSWHNLHNQSTNSNNFHMIHH